MSWDITPCWEGKDMYHVKFDDSNLFNKALEELSNLSDGLEVHKEENLVCVPDTINKAKVVSVLKETREEKEKKHHPNATDPYSYEDWEEMIEWSFDKKVEWSKKKLLTELKKSKKPAVSFSGGKSSEVALHLTLSFDTVPKIEVVYNDTGVVFPETTPFVKKLSKEWEFDLTITEPEKTFFQCVEEYGWPEPRSGGPGHGEPRCCYWLKMKPMREFVKENNIDLFVTGEQTTESMNRRVNFLQYGESFRYKNWSSKGHKVWKCKPIAIWKDEDIWNYLKRNNLSVNPAYEEYEIDRTGCFTCTSFEGWEEKMRDFSEKLYQRAKREKDGQEVMEAFIK